MESKSKVMTERDIMMIILRKKLNNYISVTSHLYNYTEISQQIGMQLNTMRQFCSGKRDLGLENYLKVSKFLKKYKKVV